jgi:hypothetical protein
MPLPSSPDKRLEWENRLRQQKESGLSIERWCRENQIIPSAFYYWKYRLYPKRSLDRSSFTELTDKKGHGISIEYRGLIIRIDRHFDAVALKRCLSLLLEAKC